MIVFCPNCGTQNPGLPGARATCTACASTFDVPPDAGSRAPPTPERAPVAEPPPKVSWPKLESPPQPVVAAGRTRAGRKTNALAIVSLVAGIICCIPFVSPGLAIGCGIGALKQFDATSDAEAGRGLAIAGIILGALTAVFQLLGMIGSISR
ncbi:MAG: hypothetical protein H6Q89_4949 [Myxococcaceae bacterium]|nr:hypothetical protein [Myxococcaceae bacterium]